MKNSLIESVLKVCKILNTHSVEYMVVGGTAVALHGYLRQSHDPSSFNNRIISKIDNVELPYISYNDLLESKLALARSKDIEDIEQMRIRKNDPE